MSIHIIKRVCIHYLLGWLYGASIMIHWLLLATILFVFVWMKELIFDPWVDTDGRYKFLFGIPSSCYNYNDGSNILTYQTKGILDILIYHFGAVSSVMLFYFILDCHLF